MLRKLLPGLVFAGLAALALPAGAVTLDFVALAAGNEHGFLSEDFTNIGGSGVTATVTARALADNSGSYDSGAPYGYLDDLLNGLDGGLGVCPTSNCAGSAEDNISLREVAMVKFDHLVKVHAITFSNGDHLDLYDGNVGINVGAADPTTAEAFNHIFPAAAVINTSLTGTRFSFVANESFLAGSLGEASKIYVSSISFCVPEPGSMLLLGMGLLGLAIYGRRRQA